MSVSVNKHVVGQNALLRSLLEHLGKLAKTHSSPPPSMLTRLEHHACMQPATVLHPVSHVNLCHHTPPASAIPRLPVLRLRRRILLLLLRRIGLLRRLLLVRGLCWRIHRLPGRLLPINRLRLVVWRGLVAVLHGRLVDRRSRCRRSRRRREQRETRRRPTRPLARRVLAQLSAHMLQRNELCLWRAHNPAQTTRGSSQVLA